MLNKPLSPIKDYKRDPTLGPFAKDCRTYFRLPYQGKDIAAIWGPE